MKRERYPDTHEYVFQLTLEINSALTFSSGEVTNLVLDGLFALDRQGILFPGVTNPEKRLRNASMEAVGYERSDDTGPFDGAYKLLVSRSGGSRSKRQREFTDALWNAADAIGASMLHQHMLVAKIHGLAARCLHPTSITEADRATAAALISAAEAITAAVQASTKPVL